MDDDHDGQVLRALREARGLSIRTLAACATVSKSQIGLIESGDRSLTAGIAHALDQVFGTSILRTLVSLDGDPVRRRTFINGLGFAAGAGFVDAALLGDGVRVGLTGAAAAEPVVDWDDKVDSYGRALVTDPSPTFGSGLLADMMTVEQKIRAGQPSRDLLRAGAGLAQVYGLWMGNRAKLVAADEWYSSAVFLADQSGDTALQTWTRGRGLARQVYETMPVEQVLTGVEEVLALTSRPTVGAVEAYVAAVSAYALTGDLPAGRRAIAKMRQVVDQLPPEMLRTMAGPEERTYFLSGFLECRVGTLADAERACDLAAPKLRTAFPLWADELEAYRGRARVAHGDVEQGVDHALNVVRGLHHDVRVIGVAVRDLLSSLPAGYRTDQTQVLRGYAATGPMPWQRVR